MKHLKLVNTYLKPVAKIEQDGEGHRSVRISVYSPDYI